MLFWSKYANVTICDDSQLKSCQKEVKEGNVNRNKVDIARGFLLFKSIKEASVYTSMQRGAEMGLPSSQGYSWAGKAVCLPAKTTSYNGSGGTINIE